MPAVSDRIWRAIAIVSILALGMTTLVLYRGGAVEAAGPAASTSTEVQTVEVALSEFAIQPADLTVAAGTPVEFVVTNTGAIEHDFTIDGIDGTASIAGGATETLSVDALEPGTYGVLCTIVGHDTAGMTGTLIVTEEAGSGELTDTAVVEAGGIGAAAVEDHAAAEDHAAMTPEEMVRLHEEGVASFPVATEGRGNQPLEPEIDADGTKVFELTADEIQWETKPGVVEEGMAYNGQIPGPRLDVDLGDRVRIVLVNELDEPTSLHSHGLIVPNDMDGVPGLNQPSIMPGESFTYEFEITNAGSHMYHSHFNSAEQVTKGLLGAFVVHSPDDPDVALDYTMILNDGPLGFTINGKDFPATEPLVVDLGDRVRIRYMNEGLQIHPMHLHGIPQQVVAKDGWPLPEPYMADTVMVGPGERIDVLVDASEPGPWAFHCHILTHAEAADGMFGMVTAMIVE